MNSRAKLLSAVSLALIHASGTATGAVLGDLVERCEACDRMDRVELQALLKDLLQENPSDPSIPYIVDLLGGAPLAQAAPASGEANSPLLLLSESDDHYGG